MTSVDVVVPCYNYARYLKGCVETVLSQRDVDLRVLIIDDMSSDNTPDVGQALAAADPRVTFRRHAVNQRHIRTFNEGIIGWATADYTLLLSADDALTAGALARAAAVLDAHPDVGLVYGKAVIVRGDDQAYDLPDVAEPTYQVISGPDFIKYNCEVGNPAPSPAVMLRTSLQHRLGGYHEKMQHTSDMEMWMRFATQGPVAAIRDAQAYYRWHGDNMTVNYVSNVLGDRQERFDTCLHVYEQWGGGTPGFDEWMAAMRDRFARESIWIAREAFEAGDGATYRRCREAAARFDPTMPRQAIWRRQQIRSILGPQVMRALRPLIERGRGRPVGWESAKPPTTDPFATVTEFGWWPTAERT